MVRWKNPPKERNYGKWKVLVDVLRTQPGRWAEAHQDPVPEAAYSVASLLRKYGCEATTRTRDGISAVYVRWPNEEKEEA